MFISSAPNIIFGEAFFSNAPNNTWVYIKTSLPEDMFTSQMEAIPESSQLSGLNN